MTNMLDHRSLSNLELLVLARLSCADGAHDDELAAAVAEIAPPDEPGAARDHAGNAVAVLRRRSLATTPKPTKKTPRPRSKLTEEGRRVLRAAFGLDATPNWVAVRDRCVPAAALGIPGASAQAGKLGNAEQLVLTVLRHHFHIAQATTTIALCDALIAKALGFTGPVTMLRLRAHVLARDLGLDARVASTEELEVLAARAASKSQDEAGDGKRPLRQLLGRRWAYRVTAAPPARLTLTTASADPPSGPAHDPPRPPQRPPELVVVPADMLLTLVREAIPRIGADGRFGDEKVFVSAIWRYIEDDGRLPDLSLERFKRWLVTANRDQLLDLARADALGDMDSQLVEDSEINDLDATFHFVVDRQASRAGRGFHAR